MEELLTDLMFQIPSDRSVEKVIITPGCVSDGEEPKKILNPNRKPAQIPMPPKNRPRKDSAS